MFPILYQSLNFGRRQLDSGANSIRIFAPGKSRPSLGLLAAVWASSSPEAFLFGDIHTVVFECQAPPNAVVVINANQRASSNSIIFFKQSGRRGSTLDGCRLLTSLLII
ncbi:unnamed protein product [Soboliphyme baturini]|uniref:Uncharacterized protein n=1 Tax=Soboliphyme baturini TaxID=241478 RepID=A0A183II85_9BILA|nr:unnamed protein product [Soboliphyme baturini]